MAWIGVLLGTFAGLASSIFACVIWELPLWAALMIYPVAGSAIAVAVILLFMLREIRVPAAEPVTGGRIVNG